MARTNWLEVPWTAAVPAHVDDPTECSGVLEALEDRFPIDDQNRLAAPYSRTLSGAIGQHVADAQRRRVGQHHAHGATGPSRGTGRVRFGGPEATARAQNSVDIAPAGEEFVEGCRGQIIRAQ